MRGQLVPQNLWEKMRHGKFTASVISDLFTEPKTKKDQEAGKLSDSAAKLVRKKASEIITGTYRGFENDSTEWGNLYEPEAALEIRNKYGKENIEFIYYGKQSPEFFEFTDWSGGSPDGLLPIIKTVAEIKCPEDPSNHIDYCDITDSETLKDIFKICWYQMQFNMACVAKRNGWEFMEMKGLFVSYCPIVVDGYKKYHEAEILPDKAFFLSLPLIIQKAEAELKNRVLKMKTK